MQRILSMLGSQSFTASRPEVRMQTGAAPTMVHRHLFTRGDGRQFVFLWTRTGEAVVDVEIGGVRRAAIEYAISGNAASRVRIADGWIRNLARRAGNVRMFEVVR